MPDALKARKSRSGAAKTVATTNKPDPKTEALTAVTEASASEEDVKKTATEVAKTSTTTETSESTETSTSTSEGDVKATASSPDPDVDPFAYDESILTLTFSFLPLAEGTNGRQVVVSCHSKNGAKKGVLPEFIAPLNEADIRLPPSVLALVERYRTTVLPQRKAEAEAKAKAVATKRPVKSSKDARPSHIQTGTALKRTPAIVKTQLKLNLSGGTKK
jgi:hypothetical protein